ncbi:MAG TPA: putative lipopolysaccharide heptosyltransferase III [Chthoniobacterales bacterium]|nr:putative lipopolysaccharide heptosyltransferase III [Chthoniobacterales bacterium]
MNILLIQLRRIGDLILTTPTIAALREKFPEAHITLVVSAGTRELLPAIRGVDDTIVARGKLTDAASFFGVARRKFTYCFDFTRNDRSGFVALLSGARQRVTADYPRRRGKLQSIAYNVLVPLDVGRMHTVDYHLGLVEAIGIRDASPHVQLTLPPSAREQAEHVLSTAGLRREFIVLHPGSARAEKFWNAERWAEIIAWLDERGVACALSGGKSALEQAHIAEIKRHTGSAIVDFSGRVDLLTLAAVIERAQLLVTVDSAPVHLAAATKTPQVALFGPTNPFHWHPRSSPAIILQGGTAYPPAEFSPKAKPAAMSLISTGGVIDAMEALLATPRGATL